MAECTLKRFEPNDEFLRRVRLKDHIKKGLVRWRAFKDGDPRMSFTFRDQKLHTEEGLKEYHAYCSEKARVTLPAILWFSFRGLVMEIEPPLEPEHDPVKDDPVYGHLHCSTEAPHDRVHRDLMAKLVNDNVYAGIAWRHVA